ncbi:MAG: SAM-dependent methyltransferase [Lachnospiraceae bacterium]|nr:SAM-dependent methyltransferase [Lachnospiraceae bacterium]
MVEVRALCEEYIGKELYQIIISNPKNSAEISKVKIRPIMLKNTIVFQVTEYKGTQVFHENYEKNSLITKVMGYLENNFKQMELTATNMQATVLISKKGKVTVKKKSLQTEKKVDLSHNKAKKYILQEGTIVPFLVDLGVQTKEGKIVRSNYDKFRQINRYLEFIADIMPILPTDRPINIIDFGCGKSYLTFALYYYMKILCKRDIQVIGLDLKEKVIEDCNALAVRYGYEGLKFVTGDVSTYTGEGNVDMVVTLHACDTATDYALEKAVSWGAKVIFTVPCCQHEVNMQIKNEELQPLLKYGLIKERISALITDAIRANLLEEQGYQVQVMEFIDMEHTPKNILIRAVKEKEDKKIDTGISRLTEFLHVRNTMQELMTAKENRIASSEKNEAGIVFCKEKE